MMPIIVKIIPTIMQMMAFRDVLLTPGTFMNLDKLGKNKASMPNIVTNNPV